MQVALRDEGGRRVMLMAIGEVFGGYRFRQGGVYVL